MEARLNQSVILLLKVFIFLAVGTAGLLAEASYQQDVIYGQDDRLDVYAEPDVIRRSLSESTAAMVRWTDLSLNTQGLWSATVTPFSKAYGLCEDEPFYHQPTLANCTAFLVGDDLVATAGHCMGATTCDRYAFVFGFHMKDSDTAITDFPGEDVYRCEQVIVSEYTRAEDYALIRLDRPVRGRRPLALRSEGKAKAAEGEDVFVIGHPMGLPTKIAGGAQVRSWRKDIFFVANLDTYGGNSGSPVFNSMTNEVEGILVRGETDLERNVCVRSKLCSNGGCRGEDVVNISYIQEALSTPASRSK